MQSLSEMSIEDYIFLKKLSDWLKNMPQNKVNIKTLSQIRQKTQIFDLPHSDNNTKAHCLTEDEIWEQRNKAYDYF